MKSPFFLLTVLLTSLFSCNVKQPIDLEQEEAKVNQTLDNWHAAAAKANYHQYFSYMDSNAIFIGTDPTEYWTCDSFKLFCKPYFDKGKAWSFSCIKRHIYFSDDASTAWIDELLSTQMKICRGSAVLRKSDKDWKIIHYVLSMSIPNELTKEVTIMKSNFDDSLMNGLKAQQSP